MDIMYFTVMFSTLLIFPALLAGCWIRKKILERNIELLKEEIERLNKEML